VVAALLEHGVTHRWVRRAIEGLRDRGRWPLSRALLATAPGARATRVALQDRGDVYLLTNRGWQLTAAAPELQPLEPSLRRRAGDGGF
jgi:hypothetical protein